MCVCVFFFFLGGGLQASGISGVSATRIHDFPDARVLHCCSGFRGSGFRVLGFGD